MLLSLERCYNQIVMYWPNDMPMNLVLVLDVKEPYWAPGCHLVDVIGYVY